MKRFLRSKLALSLVAFMLITVAIAIPLSGSITRTLAQGSVTISEFPVPTACSLPFGITGGPDGNVWFTEAGCFSGGGNKIGKITPSGAITEFPIPTSGSSTRGITTGPDGNLWFTEEGGNKIGKITTSGTITEFPPIPTSNSNPLGITTGPDSNLWFTEYNAAKIGKMTTSGAITEFSTPTSNSFPRGITTGPDGNLWFTEEDGNKIGKITTSGAITEFSTPTSNSMPVGITTGPDGNLWFTESQGNEIGKITTSGITTEFSIPTGGSDPFGIAKGSDGNLWFAESIGNKIGKITPSGTITEFSIPTSGSDTVGITAGPDGNLWFTEVDGNKIGRVNLPPQLKQLSSDPYTNSTSQHKTEVEPDIFSFGSTMVAAFQVSRFSDQNGGSDNIGWVTSSDNGATWKKGFLPGITKIAGGTYDRVSDPVVSYDASHQTWMIVSIGIAILNGSVEGTAVLVSRSSGGLTWNNPVVVGSGEFFDKPWITCDNTASSPNYGHCYIEWDDAAEIAGGLIVMATSTNGGINWVQATTANNATGIGGQPLVQPNGTVIVPIDDINQTTVMAFTSTNGGTSWSSTVTVAQIQVHTEAGGLRSGPLPSAAIDGSGKVYVVWQDCRFETGCSANDIVMSTSTNGTTWSLPKRISPELPGKGFDHFIPGLAVDKSTSGNSAHMVLVYYYYPVASCSTNCQLDIGFVSSSNGGSNWSARTKLAGPMSLTWLPNSDLGFMVGDYISVSFSGSKAYPVFAVAKAPSGTLLNEAVYTVMGGLS